MRITRFGPLDPMSPSDRMRHKLGPSEASAGSVNSDIIRQAEISEIKNLADLQLFERKLETEKLIEELQIRLSVINELITALGFFVRDFFDIKKVMSLFKHRIKLLGIGKSERDELIKAAKSEIIIARRIALLRTSQKLFHWWHIFHLPFAIAMFVIMVIHVAVTIIFGYKWIF